MGHGFPLNQVLIKYNVINGVWRLVHCVWILLALCVLWSLRLPPLQAGAFALGRVGLRDSAGRRPRQGRRARGAARSRVGPPESVAPAAPSDPERR